ncbi:MAG: lysophospholipid acyltransferase family protein [Flavobacterium nitrogenifigens]|uniref:KDO2-lipid IV(A) lauroyltransferase n=1 Tax=Flavobacterium nitrogenifigens TaxID=1617283 RepID=A0A521E050_9FLAO|nr:MULTISPECIES: lysophospholipid acyltransferase family protein [Flavobacterium]KAF2333998.1 lysophospholipid acyltransferase family protein [Flavobacterium nitrogenifigens]MDQ8013270.1 lysophospholipid acyltransferase family protein [Flavobacterium nitrogenifigens]WDF66525.1 lysophospholipid acyltransferase family protein [Flavobacterium sp. KACC 22763]SMO76500.1 KDO2-lipid IV(A) lauroyltransferase [Flavobacterium nitrogenifigens]
MQFLVYILAYPLLWLISILPFPIFYLFSDFVCFLVYRVIGYRKKVVRENLALTLPHLNDAERKVIEKKFYKHMCDLFLEMVKTMSMSPEEMERRFHVTNIDLVLDYAKRGKSVILVASHYASYEWLLTINPKLGFQGVAVYKRLANPYFDRLIRKIRSKYNTEMIETRKAIPTMAKNQREGILSLYGLASDQSPKMERIFHSMKFMGVEVPVHTGAETLAKKYDLAVLFVEVKKVRRGYYEATFIPLADNPKEFENFKITEMYLKEVEKQILEAPEFYLWTHKRWKHRIE